MKWTTEAKVGAFSLAGLIVFAIIIVQLTHIVLFGKAGFLVTGVFPEAEGITPGNDIRYAGVTVGRVDRVGVNEGKAVIVMRLYNQVQVPSDAVFSIQSSGVMGGHFINITEGNLANGELTDGMTIYGQSAPGFNAAMKRVDALINSTQQMLNGINTVVTDPASQQSVKNSIRNMDTVTQNLTVLTSEGIRVAAQAEDVTSQMNDMLYQLNHDGKVTSDVRTILDNMVVTSENAKELSFDAQRISHRVGGILSGEGLSGNAELLYNTTKGKFSPDLEFRIGGGDRFGILGAESMGNDTRYNAQYGFGSGAWTGHAGIIRDRFGAGTDYAVGRWKFKADFYDPDRPTFRFWSAYMLHPNIYLAGQTIQPHDRTGGGEYIGLNYTY